MQINIEKINSLQEKYGNKPFSTLYNKAYTVDSELGWGRTSLQHSQNCGCFFVFFANYNRATGTLEEKTFTYKETVYDYTLAIKVFNNIKTQLKQFHN